jgi:hypothetical protein
MFMCRLRENTHVPVIRDGSGVYQVAFASGMLRSYSGLSDSGVGLQRAGAKISRLRGAQATRVKFLLPGAWAASAWTARALAAEGVNALLPRAWDLSGAGRKGGTSEAGPREEARPPAPLTARPNGSGAVPPPWFSSRKTHNGAKWGRLKPMS